MPDRPPIPAAAAALREAERRHRQILDSAVDTVIVSTDLAGRVTRWSEGARRIIGYDEAEMIGRPIDLFFTPEDRAAGRMAQEMAQALSTGHGEYDGWRVRKDGTRFWASGQLTPLRDEAGHVTGFVKIVRDRTAERTAADALAASQEQLRLAQSAGGIGVFAIDTATNAMRVSPEFCRLYGMAVADTIVPEDFERLIVADDRSIVSDAASRRTGTIVANAEYRVRRPDTGEIRWLHRKAELLRDGDGRIIRMLGVAQDITDRKAAEDALRASEAQFRTFAQAVPNHVWTAPGNGRLDWFNDRVYEYCGLSFADLAGDLWAGIVHPDDRAAAGESWAQSVATGVHYETEFRIRRADGRYRWHLVRAVPIAGDKGVVRWIGTNTDIDEQKAALAVLAASNQSLESAVAARTADRDRTWQLSTDILLVARLDATIQAVNPAWTRLLGWAESDLVGRSFADFIHPDDLAATAREVERMALGITTLRFENRYRTRDGTYRAIEWTAVPDHGLIHAVGRDVTAERAAAAELEQAQDALRQAQKMEAVGQLTGGIAHDFNNLLTGILGSLEILKRRLDQGRTADVARFVTAATTSAQRAAALTHRLLAFSRRQPLDPRPVDPDRLLAGMAELLRRTIGDTIVLTIAAEGGWQTLCDPHQLENAILNLAINARDAMPDGGALSIMTCDTTLDAAAAHRHGDISPGDYACICVADTGQGMPPEVIAKAFDPFFTTKPIGQGTGLGLSMIYGFARQSEGHVAIESFIGEGTSVRLYLPRHRGAPASIEAAPPARIALSGTLRPEIVAVVEDEPAVRALVVDVLHDMGFGAIEAEDGPAGLALVESDARIDLLVTDIGLPGLNGRRLADLARGRRPDLRILFMTGYAQEAAKAEGFLDAGMALITKPFAIDALARRIGTMIDGAVPADGSAPADD